ncbi:uncharacterized protein TNCV_1988351 [Trichonephila clavipes]|nr:uncharacterized protein TNCV_1988351 [Trichonephila clavipes]
MEHLWDLIGWDMNRGLLAQTVDVLRTALDVAWHRLSHATIYLLIERMPRRMEACIAATEESVLIQEHLIKILNEGLKPIFEDCSSPVIKILDRGRHVMSSSPVPLKNRRVGQRCTLNLSRAETSSHWYGVVVRRRWCQLWSRPRHLTMVQNYVVHRQKPSCS